jgi:hypothetical protein
MDFFFNSRYNRSQTQVVDREFSNLFNGYDELGGDVRKYSQTATYYETHVNQLVLAMCGVMSLDKPSSWLFSGRSNEDNKKIAKKLEELSRLSKVDNLTDDATKRAIDNLVEIVQSEPALQIVHDEILLVDSGGNKVGKDLHRYLPHYEQSELNSFSDEDLNKMRATRCFWDLDFRTVNISKLKRVGLMYLELHGSDNKLPIADQYIKIKGGRPTKMSKFGKNAETVRIMTDIVNNFKADRDMWSKYRRTFSGDFSKGVINVDQPRTTLDDTFIAYMSSTIKLSSKAMSVINGK